MAVHPNSLANLKPAWSSETSPRNRGRPKGFVAFTDHIKSLSVTSTEDLRAIMSDEAQLPLRRAAARQLLMAAGDIEGARVRPSDILASASELADRTEGKPVQKQIIDASVEDYRPIILDKTKLEASISGARMITRDDNAVVSDEQRADDKQETSAHDND